MIQTVYGLLDYWAAKEPNRTALFYDERVVSYGELRQESLRAAAGLSALGIGLGDRVALWLPNCPAYLALYIACARIGAIMVAVNTRFRSSEVSDIVGRSGSKALIYWPDFRGIAFTEILADCDRAAFDRLSVVVRYEEGLATAGTGSWTPHPRCQVLGYPDLLRDPSGSFAGGPDDPCNVFTTSGTTKAPKFVLHGQRGVARHAQDVAHAFAYDRKAGSLLQMLPLGGVFGFNQMTAALAAGRASALMSSFDAERAIALCDQHGVEDTNGSDDMYAAILEVSSRERPLPLVRECGFAAFNPTLADLVERAENRGLTLCGCYGMSEVQALFARQCADGPAETRRRGGGPPVSPEAQVRVRDPDSGALLGAGENGLLELRGPSLMLGYFGNEEATRDTMTEDGFVRTGDLGYLHADGGGFEYLSRLGDVLRLGGYLVSAGEIEAEVQGHPSIAGCQVVGGMNEGRPVAIAFVRLGERQSLDEEALRSHCADRLARFKVPARFVALADFPTVPSPNGPKISKAELRKQAAVILNAERAQ